ncbi:phage tail tube protein [Mangrovibrevibacter kandeliae]|uniref:phage tail tube protein n=1 Tax=Mangrovibrevibacter kandeliae TaxID=2968473 RepID=UPI0021188116|nr:phage tail tube protein [Aurantimonas sp. CSK15Z-1]MCQ8781720.1 phage tail tube protein [Aurantimonas sp. CSK15Z-1]
MVGINSSKTRLAYVPEVTWGTTPATPAFKNLRFTGEGLNADKETVTSNEIRPDRNVSDVIQVGRSAAGNINAEFSYGTFDALFESALGGAFATDVLKNGILQKAMTFEKTFKKADGSSVFHRFPGAVVNTMQLSVTSKQTIGLVFNVMSKGVAAATTAITGATYADANSNTVLSAATDFASLTMPELSSVPIIKGLTINTTNNLRQQDGVGSIDSYGIGDGRFEVTGSLNAYFEGGGLYDAFIDHSALSLSFTLGTAAGSRYTVVLPKVKITSGTITAGGNDQEVMADLNFQALYADGIAATMQITRAV